MYISCLAHIIGVLEQQLLENVHELATQVEEELAPQLAVPTIGITG